jgi:hypothetical protein
MVARKKKPAKKKAQPTTKEKKAAGRKSAQKASRPAPRPLNVEKQTAKASAIAVPAEMEETIAVDADLLPVEGAEAASDETEFEADFDDDEGGGGGVYD